MGYYQNKHENWIDSDPQDRVCEYCGGVLHPLSPNQKRHSYDHDDLNAMACAWEYELEHMGPRAYLKHVGMTKEEYIQRYGQDQYETIVLGKNAN